MNIALIRRVAAQLKLERQGDTLIFNGAPLDLSPIPEGGVLPPDGHDCPWIIGPIERVNGQLRLTLIAPYRGGHLSPEMEATDPILDPPDGEVELPSWEIAHV